MSQGNVYKSLNITLPETIREFFITNDHFILTLIIISYEKIYK